MAFYFVSQRNQKNENEMGKLTAPNEKKYEYIKNTRKDDLIVQYNSVSRSITGVAVASKNPYVSDNRIYIDVDINTFAVALPKHVWVKQLRECQDGLKTPVNANLSINSRYLQKMNTESFNCILDLAEKNNADQDVVKRIRDLCKLTPSYDFDDTSYSDEDDGIVCMQKILFGAPGTGKSHKIDNDLFKDENGNLLGLGLKSISQDFKFRTTFHPDYDYAQFVGSYKPKKEGSSITYSFVPQVFAKAYTAAWNKFIAADKKSTADNQVYLVIEEINRGNCAQIFGDIFQLLDRNEEGFSSYSIDADADFADWLKNGSELEDSWENYVSISYVNSDGDTIYPVPAGKIALPPNFNILATMNTSDQSLFPMDSAFKRRFDWVYVPIDFAGKDCADYQIEIGGEKPYSWQKFVESVNEKIFNITDSEDKQLGEYFIKLNPADNNIITKERFLGKVMFYLWNEVCKDVHKQESFFREEENGNYFTFQDLYKKDGDKKLISFMNWITE